MRKYESDYEALLHKRKYNILRETKKFEIDTVSVRETKKNKGKVKYWRKHSHPVPY